jgi:hypothetical protein
VRQAVTEYIGKPTFDAGSSVLHVRYFPYRSKRTIVASFDFDLVGDQLALVTAHEGRHVADALNFVNLGHPVGGLFDLNHFSREQRGWEVSGVMAEALGMKSYSPKGAG